MTTPWWRRFLLWRCVFLGMAGLEIVLMITDLVRLLWWQAVYMAFCAGLMLWCASHNEQMRKRWAAMHPKDQA